MQWDDQSRASFSQVTTELKSMQKGDKENRSANQAFIVCSRHPQRPAISEAAVSFNPVSLVRSQLERYWIDQGRSGKTDQLVRDYQPRRYDLG